MPLNVTIRKQTGAITITGTLKRSDGTTERYQQRASSDILALAVEEAARLETEFYKRDWYGPQGGFDAHPFNDAITKYLEAKPQTTDANKVRLAKLRDAIGGNTPVSQINQDTIAMLRNTLFAGQPATPGRRAIPPASEATILRHAITPLRAILKIAAKRKWCEPPDFETPEIIGGRRLVFFFPAEAEALIAAAADHLKPLLIFLFCTGCRMSEALYLDWRDVDLNGRHVILWPERTKSKKRRDIILPPRAVITLGELQHREGAVFRTDTGEPYEPRDDDSGGQIKSAWAGARRRAGLRRELSPHCTRHTWASWHYAVNRDLLLLKIDGGWGSTSLVEIYAHLMPVGYEQAIFDFLGQSLSEPRENRVTRA